MTDPAESLPVTVCADTAFTLLPGSQHPIDTELPARHYGIVVADNGHPLAIVTATDIERARYTGAHTLSDLAGVVLKAVTVPAEWTLADALASEEVAREAETHPYGLVVLAGDDIAGVLPSRLLRTQSPEAPWPVDPYPGPPEVADTEQETAYPSSPSAPAHPPDPGVGTPRYADQGGAAYAPPPPGGGYGGYGDAWVGAAPPESSDSVLAGDAATEAVRVLCDHPACGYENDIGFYDPDRLPACANPGLPRHALSIRQEP